MVNSIKPVAKAVASGLAALVGTLVTTLSLMPPEHQGIQYVTQLQWGIIGLAVLASYGITWRVPNTPINVSVGESLPGETPASAPEAVSGAQVASQPYMGQTVTAADQGKHVG